jgi:hypothetical protein
LAKIQTSTAIDQGIYQMLEDYCAETGESKISVFERALKLWIERKREGSLT